MQDLSDFDRNRIFGGVPPLESAVKGDVMAHLVAARIAEADGEMRIIEQEYIEQNIMSQDDYAEMLISSMYGSYDGFAKSVRQYIADHPEEVKASMKRREESEKLAV